MQIIQEQTDVRESKPCSEGESKVRSMLDTYKLPLSITYRCTCALFSPPSSIPHIPRHQLPGITLNRQTDGRKGKNFWCAPEI